MKKEKLLYSLLGGLILALILMAAPMTSAMAIDTMPGPIDQQSWQLLRDRTWDNFVPNPVIDWKDQVNPAGYYNVRNSANRVSKIRGALCLFEYLDRPFITSQPIGSDVLGYYLFKDDGSGYDYEKGIVHNPVLNCGRSLKESEYATNSSNLDTYQKDPVFANWWRDYLIGEHSGNHDSSQEEFYLENTYGKYHLNFDAYGPFEVLAFEFEIRDSYQGTSELPPSFRSGTSYSASNPYGLRSTGTIDTWAFAIMSAKLGNSFIVNTYDFFHILHAGYDESGVWQEFGMGQFAKRSDLPDELTPIGRMHKVEEVLTARPELLAVYSARYTAASGACFREAKARYDATLVAGYSGTPWGQGNNVFKLSQADWDWANAWKYQTTRNTRYVAWTSWEAGVGEWSHMSSTTTFGSSRNYSTQGECDGMATFAHEFGHISGIGDNYGNPYTGRVTAATEPWELMSRGSFAGPFGDHARWTCPGIEGGSVPVHFMQTNKQAASCYDTGDVLTFTNQQLAGGAPIVAEIVARNIPLNNSKTTARPQGLYPWLETDFDIPLVSPNVYKSIRMTFGTGTWADAATPRVSTGYSNFQASATRMAVEVVQRTGYDSFAPDDGVIISRNNQVVSSHCYDIALVDYMVKDGLNIGTAAAPNYIDDYVSYPLAHAQQLYDAAFKAGKSVTDTGYYRSIYETGKYYQQTANGSNVYNTVAAPSTASYASYAPRYYASESSGMSWQQALVKPGSIMQWEPQDGRPVASGNTVNEFYDIGNKIHVYIIAKNEHKGRVINGEQQYFDSYTIGMLHDNGVPVNGDLNVGVGSIEAEVPRNVAVINYEITNTGSATDIIRVKVDGHLDPVLLNDFYAIKAGETITVPVYVYLPKDIRTIDLSGKEITLSASSESNSAKFGSVTIPVTDVIHYNYRVFLEYVDVKPVIGETFSVDLLLEGDINYCQIATEIGFDPNLLEFAGYKELIGWTAAVTKPAANIVAVRSVPQANMLIGNPCPPPGIKIVTLQFKVKDSFTEPSVDTKICVASAVVSPPGGVTGTGVYPLKCIPITVHKWWTMVTFNGNAGDAGIILPFKLPTVKVDTIKVWSSTKVIELPTAHRHAYFFEGWDLNGVLLTDALIADGSIKEQTVYARWDAKYKGPLTKEEAKFLSYLDYDKVDYLAHYISEEIGNRSTHSPRRDMTVDWVVDELTSYGYTPEVKTFTTRLDGTAFAGTVNGLIKIGGKHYAYVGPAYAAGSVYTYNNRTEQKITGAVVVPWANQSNPFVLPAGDYAGKAVFVTMNAVGTAVAATMPSAANAYAAALALQNAGAAAVIFQTPPMAANGNTTYARLANTTSGTPITIPVGTTLNYETSGMLASLNANTEVSLTMYWSNELKNVIARIPAAEPTGKTVYVTNHIDTTTSGPGLNDNGSGVIMSLEMARAFRKIEWGYNIVFVFFDSEEANSMGGSTRFCQEMSVAERADFVANYNMDMIATSQADCEWMFMNISDTRLQTIQNAIPSGANPTVAIADNPAAEVVAEEYGIYKTTMKAAGKLNFIDKILICYDTTTDHVQFVRNGMPNAVEYDWRGNRRGSGFELLYHKAGDNYALNYSTARCQTQGDIIALAIFYAGLGSVVDPIYEIIVNFPGFDGVTVEHSNGTLTTTLPGTFNNTTGPASTEVPEDTKSVKVIKGVMEYEFTNLVFKSDGPLVLDVPIDTISMTGIDDVCNLGLTHGGSTSWVYPLAPATVGEINSFLVFNNGKPYEIQMTKSGFFDIERPDAYAGQTIHFGSPYFYTITVPAGISNVIITSNGQIVNGVGAGTKINLLCDFLGTIREAQLSFVYNTVTYNVTFLLDGTDPFSVFGAIPYAKAEHITGNQSRLTIMVYEFTYNPAHVITNVFYVENNVKGTYSVGPCSICGKTYLVYVDVKGTDQIRECRIMQSDPVFDDDDDVDDDDIK